MPIVDRHEEKTEEAPSPPKVGNMSKPEESALSPGAEPSGFNEASMIADPTDMTQVRTAQVETGSPNSSRQGQQKLTLLGREDP